MTDSPSPKNHTVGTEPFAYAHPIGAIWRLDNYPAGMDFSRDGWFPLYRSMQVLDGISERFIRDAIRSAYDQGYNDARLPLNLPRDNAPGYRGREKSDEIAVDALAQLRRRAAQEDDHG